MLLLFPLNLYFLSAMLTKLHELAEVGVLGL